MWSHAELDGDWTAVATSPKAREAIAVWAERFPEVHGFDSPAALVAAIGRRGDPDRSCRLLSCLLVLATGDDLAVRATFQAVLPGLGHAARRRWERSAGNGPWCSADEVTADALSAGWEAIRAHAGETHDRPAAVIVRCVEGRLRRAHRSWWRAQDRTTAGGAEREPVQSAVDAAYSSEHQAATLIADAVRAGVLDATEASILLYAGILGYTVTDVERAYGLAPRTAYRLLRRARVAMSGWAP